MLKFWQRDGEGQALSKSMRTILATERGLKDEAAASLLMVEQKGHYSGRKVTFFRVFAPDTVKAAGIKLCHFDNLDAACILHSGHTEADGQIVLNRN